MLEATEITLDRLELWLSEPRLNMYLRAAGDDPWRAYKLYLWNANSPKYYYVISRSSRSRSVTPTTDA